jgi:hypothetical protein
MNYYQLKSIVSAGKKEFQLRESSDSFFLAGEKTKPYIEPWLNLRNVRLNWNRGGLLDI